MQYSDLVAPKGTAGSISNWLNYSDQILPLEDILLDAQTILWDQLRVHDMVKTGSFTLLQNTNTVAIPGGLNQPGGVLSVIAMFDNLQNVIKARTAASVFNRIARAADGSIQSSWPSYYAIVNGQFVFDAGPGDADMAGTFLYFEQPAYLSILNETNFLTDRYPHLLRRACLMVAADYLNDDGKFARYSGMLQSMIVSVNVSNDMTMEGLQADCDYTESRI